MEIIPVITIYEFNYHMVKVLNQVVIWDKIIKTKKQAILTEKNEFVKYALIDQGAELRFVTLLPHIHTLCYVFISRYNLFGDLEYTEGNQSLSS